MTTHAAPCSCTAYRFPHRPGGGRCGSSDHDYYCEACGEGVDPVVVDFGVGAYEYWGSKGVHRDLQVVSPCCDAPCINYWTGERARQ